MATLQAAFVAFSLLGASDTVLVDFSADWCGPCRQMEPAVNQLAAAGYPVRKVNIDRERELAALYHVQSIPCFVLLVDGREVDRTVGSTSLEHLQSMMHKAGVYPSNSAGGHARGQSPDYAPPAVVTAPVAPLVPVTMPATTSNAPLAAAVSAPAPAAPQMLPSTPAMPSNNHRAADRATTPEAIMAASVRIKVQDPDGQSGGSGTIIDAREGEALVLTCGHIFRDSKGQGKITVDLFGPGAPQGVPGELIYFDDKTDLGILAIRPGVPVVPARIAPAHYALQPGQPVTSIGCNGGADPTVQQSKIDSLNKFLGPQNIQVAGQPVEGRSGGGLFSAEGYTIGVCNAADPTDNQGLFRGLEAIQKLLDEQQLGYVYQAAPGASAAGLVANAAPATIEPPSAEGWMPVTPPAMPGHMPAPEPTAIAATPPDASAPSGQYVPAAMLPASHHPGPAAGVAVLRDVAGTQPDAATLARLSPQERAALEAINKHSGGAEVICVVRPLADPRAKSEIIVLDHASPAFLQQLAAERQVQDARHLTSTSSQNGGFRPLRPSGVVTQR
ncbi:MAG: trypsin-like peptidase domain-containing protein [Pirellulales bacterium]|nr:trypsin-like peptidase domain-containing protein [Pirellulales bacterium]